MSDPSDLRTMSVKAGGTMNAAEAARFLKGLTLPYAALAVATLVGVCRKPRASSSAKVAAARELLNRAFGKPDVMPVGNAGGAARTGVLIIPSAPGTDQWTKLAREHHAKALTLSSNSPT